MDPWLLLLKDLPLSRTEREVVKRYEGDPHGRAFLPVADILRAHRLVDESLELLTQGVENHASFTVARVVLARELLHKGMVSESWRILEVSPTSLRENLLAQKLRFKLAILMEMDGVAKATYQHLSLHQMFDDETKRLGDLMEISGLAKAKQKLLEDLRSRGTDPIIPDLKPGDLNESREDGRGAEADGVSDCQDPGIGVLGQPRDWGEEGSIAGFHVVPLDEIFKPGLGDENDGGEGGGGIELDSTTLADIYARQGHYGKALAVYRRLLRLTPHNDLLRRKVAELVKLEREQRDVDLTLDPALVDRMESVEIIDRQIRFYNELLSKIS